MNYVNKNIIKALDPLLDLFLKKLLNILFNWTISSVNAYMRNRPEKKPCLHEQDVIECKREYTE